MDPRELGIGWLFECVREAVIVADVDTQDIILWNPGASSLFGYSREEACRMKVRDLVLDPLRERHDAGFARLQESGTGTVIGSKAPVEFPAKAKDGRDLTIELSLVCVDLQVAGGRRYVMAMIRDVTARAEALRKLRESEARFKLLVDQTKEYSIFMLSPEGTVTSWNAGGVRISGYEPHEVIGKHFSIFYVPGSEAHCAEELEIARTNGKFEEEGWRVKKDGTRFWANVVITPLRDDKSNLIGFSKVTRDLTERREREQQSLRLNVFDRMNDMFATVDKNMIFTFANTRMCESFGKPREEVVGKHVFDVSPNSRDGDFHRCANESIVTGKPTSYETYRTDVGKHFSVRVYPNDEGVIVFAADVTEQKKAEAALRHQVFHDVLTGLPNRILFNDRLEHAMVTHERMGSSFGLLFMDLVGFKKVNDAFGHAAGNEALKLVSERFLTALRRSDTLARVGGDEFAVLIPGVDASVAIRVAQRIASRMEAPFPVAGKEAKIGVNIGVVTYPVTSSCPNDLLEKADKAMYCAKQDGKSVVPYDKSMGSVVPPPFSSSDS